MWDTARMKSVVSATSCARCRLIRSSCPTMISKPTFMFVLACLALSGCDANTAGKRAEAESNAVAGIAEVTQFAALFPNADHFITH